MKTYKHCFHNKNNSSITRKNGKIKCLLGQNRNMKKIIFLFEKGSIAVRNYVISMVKQIILIIGWNIFIVERNISIKECNIYIFFL